MGYVYTAVWFAAGLFLIFFFGRKQKLSLVCGGLLMALGVWWLLGTIFPRTAFFRGWLGWILEAAAGLALVILCILFLRRKKGEKEADEEAPPAEETKAAAPPPKPPSPPVKPVRPPPKKEPEKPHWERIIGSPDEERQEMWQKWGKQQGTSSPPQSVTASAGKTVQIEPEPFRQEQIAGASEIKKEEGKPNRPLEPVFQAEPVERKKEIPFEEETFRSDWKKTRDLSDSQWDAVRAKLDAERQKPPAEPGRPVSTIVASMRKADLPHVSRVEPLSSKKERAPKKPEVEFPPKPAFRAAQNKISMEDLLKKTQKKKKKDKK